MPPSPSGWLRSDGRRDILIYGRCQQWFGGQELLVQNPFNSKMLLLVFHALGDPIKLNRILVFYFGMIVILLCIFKTLRKEKTVSRDSALLPNWEFLLNRGNICTQRRKDLMFLGYLSAKTFQGCDIHNFFGDSLLVPHLSHNEDFLLISHLKHPSLGVLKVKLVDLGATWCSGSVLARGRGWNWVILNVPSIPNHSIALWSLGEWPRVQMCFVHLPALLRHQARMWPKLQDLSSEGPFYVPHPETILLLCGCSFKTSLSLKLKWLPRYVL